MRAASLLAALLFLVMAGPADADITARFRQADDQLMVVEASESGESRMIVSEAVYVTTGGVTYIVLTDPQGTFVVRQRDFMALLADLLPPAEPSDAPAAGESATVAEAGSETLAGRAGTLFRLGRAQHPTDTFELVISADPELAPIGRAMAAHVAPFFTAMGGAMPGLATAASELMGRGTLIRLGYLWRLESVETAPVPPSAFALPSAPLSREALAARLGLR
jgi:hypothetical protein